MAQAENIVEIFRRLLIMMCLFLSCMTSSAQLQAVMTWDWNFGIWEFVRSEQFEYEWYGARYLTRKTITDATEVDPWVNWRYDYSYSGDPLILSRREDYQYQGGAMQAVQATDYLYDAQGRLEEELRIWASDTFYDFRVLYEYDQLDSLIRKTTFGVGIPPNEWNTTYQWFYEYAANGVITEYFSQWQANQGWDTVMRVRRTHYGPNSLDTLLVQSYNAGIWSDASFQTFVVDGKGFILLQRNYEQENGGWALKSLIQHTRNSNGRLEESLFQTADSSGTMFNDFLKAYIYLWPSGQIEANSNARIEVYPNPSDGSATLSSEQVEPGTVATLISPSGSIVRTFTLNSPQKQLNFSGLPSGVYVLSVPTLHESFPIVLK